MDAGLPEPKFVEIEGVRLRYFEAGAGDRAVLLLHGVPASAYLWRRVLPRLAPHVRVVAPEWPGHGGSDKPLSLRYDVRTYARFLGGLFDALRLDGCTLAAMDLGLVVGLHWAMGNPARVGALALFEGFVLPVPESFERIPLANRLALRAARWKWLAERVIVRDDHAASRFVQSATLRTLTAEERAACDEPWRDPAVRRRVWFEGVGPRSFGARPLAEDDTRTLVDAYAMALRASTLPKLLLQATPGSIVNDAVVARARQTLPALQVRRVGPGRHFVPEDSPEALADALLEFHRSVSPVRRG